MGIHEHERTNIIESAKRYFRLDFGGAVVGLVFFCLSFTPSLLPRGVILQGVASGLSLATGYGLGVIASFLLHKLPGRLRIVLEPAVKKVALLALGLLVIAFMAAGFNWQQDVRRITEAQSATADFSIWVLLIAAILAWLLILAGRGARRLSRWFANKVNRWLPPKVSMYLGAILATLFLIILINGVLFRTVFGFINYSFGLANKGTPEGIYQPQDSAFSGSPHSAIDWNTLGEKGREFVASSPAKKDIETFSGAGKANQPSRLYVGLESAPGLKDRVSLLVRELDRTDAASRDAVLIAIPTGSGGVNAKSIETVEYLFNGNTTSLAIQYSYLPSWLSFLADQQTARDNGRMLVEAVYEWWSDLDSTERPRLLLYGESLGTLGADGAFSGVSDIRNRMSGVLLAGPPNANQLWSNIVASRDTGSRQVLPIYEEGEAARFSDGVTLFDANPKKHQWESNRVGILQHGSDPVIWASKSLFLHKPDWLKEPRGKDVLPSMHWYPFITAWQVGLDLPFAFNATPGHGHRYGNSLTTSWIQVLDMQLSPDKTKQLQTIIDKVKG